MCTISMKYGKMILIIIIISLGQISRTNARTHARTHASTHVYAHTRAHTHTHTHTHTHSRIRTHPPTTITVQVVAARWVCSPNHDEVNAPFSHVPLAMNGRSVLHSNKQSRMRRGIRDSFGCFSRIKKFWRVHSPVHSTAGPKPG